MSKVDVLSCLFYGKVGFMDLEGDKLSETVDVFFYLCGLILCFTSLIFPVCAVKEFPS